MGMAGASSYPLAAEWTPEQVRGDGVIGASGAERQRRPSPHLTSSITTDFAGSATDSRPFAPRLAPVNATGFSVGTGTLVYAFSVSKTGNVTESVTDLDLFLQAGDVLTVTALSVNANDVTATVVWVEDV